MPMSGWFWSSMATTAMRSPPPGAPGPIARRAASRSPIGRPTSAAAGSGGNSDIGQLMIICSFRPARLHIATVVPQSDGGTSAYTRLGWEFSSSCETSNIIENHCWRCLCWRPSSRAARARPICCRGTRTGSRAPAGCSSGTSKRRRCRPTSRSRPKIWSAPRAIAREWRRPPQPRRRQRRDRWRRGRAGRAHDDGNGGARSYRMRRRARHRRARQRQPLQQSARRPAWRSSPIAGAARRNLHLHGRTPDLDRARAAAGGAAEGGKSKSRPKKKPAAT